MIAPFYGVDEQDLPARPRSTTCVRSCATACDSPMAGHPTRS